MARYKISKENINEFFGIFKSNKPKDREAVKKMIAQHPGLKAIDKEITRLNDKALADLKKDKKLQNYLKKHNIDLVKTFSK